MLDLAGSARRPRARHRRRLRRPVDRGGAARGASGAVLATDIASNILDHAEAAARACRARERRDPRRGRRGPRRRGWCSFDAAISRLGLMYLPDRGRRSRACACGAAARRPVRRARVRDAERNRFFSVPIAIIRRRAELPAPAPGIAGPFASARLPGELEAAGSARRRSGTPGAGADGVGGGAHFERESFGALHRCSRASEVERPASRARRFASSRALRRPRDARRRATRRAPQAGTLADGRTCGRPTRNWRLPGSRPTGPAEDFNPGSSSSSTTSSLSDEDAPLARDDEARRWATEVKRTVTGRGRRPCRPR